MKSLRVVKREAKEREKLREPKKKIKGVKSHSRSKGRVEGKVLCRQIFSSGPGGLSASTEKINLSSLTVLCLATSQTQILTFADQVLL